MKKKSVFSVFFSVSLSVFALSFFAFLLASLDESIALFLNRYAGGAVRSFLSLISSLFPFSLFEIAALLSLPIIIALILYLVRINGSFLELTRRFLNFIAFFFCTFAVYVWTVGIAYVSPPLYSDFVSDVETVTERDVSFAARYLLTKTVENYTEDREEYTRELEASYKRLLPHVPFLNVPRRVKPLLLSPAFSKLGTLAFYSFPNGEINLNTEIPHYTVPHTVAHEYAHTVGASGEADADFMAYITTTSSASHFARYSGYLSALESVLPYLERSERAEIYNSLPDEVLGDIAEFSKFKEKYSGRMKNAADALNSAHTDLFDKSGNKSYPFAVKLIALYIKNNP